jgi:hypothetical protein
MPQQECKGISLHRRDNYAGLNARLAAQSHDQRWHGSPPGRLRGKQRSMVAAWANEPNRPLRQPKRDLTGSRPPQHPLSTNPPRVTTRDTGELFVRCFIPPPRRPIWLAPHAITAHCSVMGSAGTVEAREPVCSAEVCSPPSWSGSSLLRALAGRGPRLVEGAVPGRSVLRMIWATCGARRAVCGEPAAVP